MSEVINVSFSQYANHVTTHLFNEQESHIPYRKNQAIDYDNSTFLSVKKNKNGTSNYTPRCLIYDLGGGLGSLNKYEYHEQAPQVEVNPIHTIRIGQEVKKNEYQKSLDMGVTKEGLLNTSNTKYWTDYNKLVHSPRNLHTLGNWNYSPDEELGIHKFSREIKFDSYNKGKEEFKNQEEESTEDFRRILEDCDLLQGVNVLTEVDSAWGGFTTEYLLSVKDEFFNNGASSKHSLWVNGLMKASKPIKGDQIFSRIRSLIELSQSSTLFFPIDVNASNSSLINEHFDVNSLWNVSSLPAAFSSSLWGLNNAYSGAIHMQQIQDSVLRGYDSRNIVNDIKIHKSVVLDELISSVDISSYYSLDSSKPKKDYIDMGVSTSNEGTSFSENYIFSSKTSQEAVLNDNSSQIVQSYVNKHANEIMRLETFPKILTSTELYTHFNVTSDLRKELKEYRKVIQRARHSSSVIEDKSELIETISHLISEYTQGYSDSEEEFD